MEAAIPAHKKYSVLPITIGRVKKEHPHAVVLSFFFPRALHLSYYTNTHTSEWLNLASFFLLYDDAENWESLFQIFLEEESLFQLNTSILLEKQNICFFPGTSLGLGVLNINFHLLLRTIHYHILHKIFKTI